MYIILAQANQEIPQWLLKLGQKIKDTEVDDDLEQFGGSDIRMVIIYYYILITNFKMFINCS